ncbi:hypothetical protein SARC_12898 [Sphaeroforma arctica JP610]|uniref:Estradiol 17-beta-dehydrogenase 12 n=1 Tax=Sphaeroforma arctica JP610 TaxID=667725 RepID=A0A0L0FDN6_9EUKA|nr:hypothetical protein SARC_12898 [Sphaeroforma arctica JP610]KNC74561.1 hypothetical protein SARC_12898 [Sphaeroforma arctica JP610]|eukprot:XP_014148463.1 hypothetical protein SARC_12898 [Sphaeroforma arctica JP610]
MSKVVAADLYNVDASVATIKAATEGMDVGILVNNVGVSYDYPCLFHDVSDERVDQLVKLNMESLTKITRAVLPGMAERRRGAIVNVSSASGMMATPLLTAYSASKAYVDFFSRGLNTEYQHLGVQVQSLMPLYVTSKLSKIRKPTLFVPTPEAFCKSAVRMIGYERRTTGYWSHQLQVGALGFLPESIQESLLLYLNRGINKAALKKIAKNKNQ